MDIILPELKYQWCEKLLWCKHLIVYWKNGFFFSVHCRCIRTKYLDFLIFFLGGWGVGLVITRLMNLQHKIVL